MTVKEFLRNVRYQEDIIKIKRKMVEELETSLVYVSPQISDMPHAPISENRRSDKLAKLMDAKKELEDEIVKSAEMRVQAKKLIESLDGDTMKWILYRRYFDALRWSDIVEQSGYSERYVYALHGRALGILSRNFEVVQ